MRINRLMANILILSSAALLSACSAQNENISGKTPGTAETTEAVPVSSWEDDMVSVKPDGTKRYSDGVTVRPGHWEKTDEIFFAPTSERRRDGALLTEASRGEDQAWEDMIFDFTAKGKHARFTVHYDMISDSYTAGETCRPSLTIRRSGDGGQSFGNILGAVYFADIAKGGDDFGESVNIREYFRRERTPAGERVIMSRFGYGKDWDGYGKGSDGSEDYYFRPVCRFPRMVAEGDRIWLVLDMADGAGGTVKMRDVWEYTWVTDPVQEDTAAAETEEDHPENTPEWIKTVYPGHWDLTDVIYVGDGSGTGSENVRAERRGVDGQEMVYRFFEGKETVTIPEERFAKRYYAGESIISEIEIFAASETAEPQGKVICSLALARVEFDTGKYGVKVTPSSWFHTRWPQKDVESFGPVPHDDTMSWRDDLGRGYLMLEGCFPEGKSDGEKTWLVYGVMDGEDGARRMYNIYEYSWTAGPDIVWTYNKPMSY